jgi:iron complex outermembrane receptor protein
LNAADSSITKGSVTNENGGFIIENIKTGNYLLKVSYVGFRDTIVSVGNIDSLTQLKLEPLVLAASAVNLNEVSVTATKKTMEFKNGNITVNIEGSPMAIGNSVYDLLMRLPGVVVSDGVITIQGKSGVRVLIDDRVQQFSAEQLMAILKGMSANQVEKIEILKNPPVKYDAAGNAGIINIVTKRIKITGFSGSVNLSSQQGFYGTQIGGIALNYKGKKFTFISGINVDNQNQNNVNHLYRGVTYNGVTTTLDQYSREKDGGIVGSAFVGLDWHVNDRNTIGMRIQDDPGSTDRTRIGSNKLSENNLGYNRLDFKGSVPNVWNYITTNLNAEHLFDTVGTKLKFNADYYNPFWDLYGGSYQNNFYNSDGTVALAPSNFNNQNTINLSILLARLDFEKKLSKTFSLEAGAKSSTTSMQSIYTLQNLNDTTGKYVTDPNFTNTFTYKEQIFAGYINLQKQVKKFALQGGLRAENTDIHTLSITNGISYARQYFNVFPTASVSYSKRDKHTFQVSFNRRIDRPDYGNFNPYHQFFGNILSVGVGNPFLYPQYTNNYEISHNYKGIVGGSFSYSRTSNFIYNYQIQNDSSKQTINTTANLKVFENYSLSMFVQKDITKWWTLTLNATGFYFGFNGTVSGVSYNKYAPAAYGYLSNMIRLPKKFKLEISGLFISPWLNAVNSFKSKGAVNFAIKKSFFNDKLNLSIGVNDIFFTLWTKGDVYTPNQIFQRSITNDTRRLVTGLTWNFGKVKVQERDVKGNDEDKKRLGH